MDDLGPSSVTVRQHDPNTVTIGGLTTSREAAIASGLIDAAQAYNGNSLKYVGDKNDLEANQSDPTENLGKAPDERQQWQEQWKSDEKMPKGLEPSPDTWQPQMDEELSGTTELIKEIDQVYGAEAFDANIKHVVQTGELPTQLPEGLNEDHMAAVLAHYTNIAEQMLAGTNVTIDDIEQHLTVNELPFARELVVKNVRRSMRALAQIVAERKAGA